jgi:hypothetical protein
METQVLGMDWDTQSDTLHTDHTDIIRALSERPATKHQVQVTSKFYDTLGLFSPVAIVGKILFQDTWTRLGRDITPGHSRQMASMNVAITSLV